MSVQYKYSISVQFIALEIKYLKTEFQFIYEYFFDIMYLNGFACLTDNSVKYFLSSNKYKDKTFIVKQFCFT
jgi:hypothetical protein